MSGRPEPSMSMVKMMAQGQPEQLVTEIERLRAERDGLREAFALKLAEYVGALKLEKLDVLKIRKPRGMDPDLVAETLERLADQLRARYGWDGVIVADDELALGTLPRETSRALYWVLEAQFRKEAPCERCSGQGGYEGKTCPGCNG